MPFNTKQIKQEARENFEKAWLKTAELLPQESKKDYTTGAGTEHPIHALIRDVRKIFIKFGFSEVENQIFISEDDVYKQYGPEAPVILDRVYYLAGLPRPDIGLSDDKILEVREIAPYINIKNFKKILRGYREGAVEGDNILEVMVNELKIKTEQASGIINLFPEFKNITPVCSKQTLRSHMTAAWFPTLEVMQDSELPLKLFSIGLRFRREQKLDATHLRAHYGASCVIMDDDISLASGKKLTEKILNELNFYDINFVKKKATSNYYAPGMEYEVFSESIEVADCGMYSPVALANYDIKIPVFNLGFGLERVLMIRDKIGDVRELLYPQFYKNLDLSDEQIAEQVRIAHEPETKEGRELAGKISKTAKIHADEKSPCSFPVYEGDFLDKKISVSVVEKEDNTKLLGPAALNEIYVYCGNVYGIPKNPGKLSSDLIEVKKDGIKVKFNFLDAVSSGIVYEIENKIKTVKTGSKKGLLQVKMAKTPSDLNIEIAKAARRFITSKNKKIILKGPVFMSVEIQ